MDKKYTFKASDVDVVTPAAACAVVPGYRELAIQIDYTKGDEDGVTFVAQAKVGDGEWAAAPLSTNWGSLSSTTITLAATGVTNLYLDATGMETVRITQVQDGVTAATGSFTIIVRDYE